MAGKKKIFISSVQKEFKNERLALKNYIQSDPLFRKFFDVFLFEDLPASDKRADKVYLAEVDHCDIYIGLFGFEYGFEGPRGISPTELEFDRATERSKTRLIFVKNGDDDKRHPKTKKLITKAGSQLIRRRFTDITDLNAALYASLVDDLLQSGRLRAKPFDAAFCSGATFADLSRKKIAEFLAQAKESRDYPLGPKTPLLKALTHLNLLDEGRPSHASILLFGKQPQRFLITSEIKCLHFHSTEIQKPIPSYHIYKGTVFELVDQAVDFVMSKIDRAVGTREKSNAVPVTYELPPLAVAEAIVNAVAHRDYTSNASVQVMLFSDRLEIWNPGELHPPLNLKMLPKPHPSLPPNPLIAEPLFLAKYIEKAGSGILDMFRQCASAGLRKPEFKQEAGSFIQILWRPKQAVPKQIGGQPKLGSVKQPEFSTSSVPVQYQSLEERIVDLLTANALPISIISTKLGQKNVSGQLKIVLNKLLSKSIVEFTIPSKPNSRLQKYRLTAKGRKMAGKG